MGWVRLDDGMHDHDKFTQLTDLADSQLEELAAVGLWSYCRTWAARHPREVDGRKTAGIVTRGIVRRFAGDLGDHLAALLVKAELWEPDDAGWRIHNAHLYEPKDGISDPADISLKRSEAGKKGATSRWQGDGKANSKAKAEPQQSDSNAVTADGNTNGPDQTCTRPEEKPPPTPSQARGRRKPKSPCPDIFPITDGMRRFVSERNIPGEVAKAELQRFLDHHRSLDSRFSDWEAAWRKWMGKVALDQTRQRGSDGDDVRGVGGISLDVSLQ